MTVASCVWGAIVLDGSGLSCTSHYILTISLQCFLVQIGPYYGCLWKDFSDIPFLTRKAFSHRTLKYTIFVMRNLWRYFNVVVVTTYLVLSFTVCML